MYLYNMSYFCVVCYMFVSIKYFEANEFKSENKKENCQVLKTSELLKLDFFRKWNRKV